MAAKSAGVVSLIVKLDSQVKSGITQLRKDLGGINKINPGTGFTKSAKQTEKALKSSSKTTAQVSKNFKDAGRNSQEFFDGTAKSAALINGPLNGVASRVTTLASIIRSINPVVAATTVTFGAFVKVLQGSVTETQQLESDMGKLEAILQSTGGVAARNAQEIADMSREIAEATLRGTSEVRNSAAALLTFKTIQGEIFDDTLKTAADLAAVTGNMQSAVMQLGRALEDPTQGLTALRRSGVSFSEDQQEVIKTLVETGNAADAQRIILKALNDQLGGAGAGAAQGLAGATDTFGERWTELMENIGRSGPIQAATSAIEGLSEALEYLNSFFEDEKILEGLEATLDQAAKLIDKAEDMNIPESVRDSYRETARALNGLAEAETEYLLSLNGLISGERTAEEAAESLAEKHEERLELVKLLNYNESLGHKQQDLFTREKLRRVDEEIAALDRLRKADLARRKGADSADRATQIQVEEQQAQERNERLRKLQEEADKERIEAVQKRAEIEAQIEQQRIKRQIALVDYQYEQNQLSLEDYLAKKTALMEESVDQERSLIDSELNTQRALLDERLRAIEKANEAIADSSNKINPDLQPEVVKIQEEINNLLLEREALTQNILDNQQSTELVYEREVRAAEEAFRKIRTEYQDIFDLDSGDLDSRFEIISERLGEQFRKSREELIKVFGEASSQVNLFDELVDAEVAKAQFAQVEDAFESSMSRLEDREKALAQQVERRQITQQDANDALKLSYEEALPEMDKLIARAEIIEQESGIPGLSDQLRQLKLDAGDAQVEFEGLSQTITDQMALAGENAAESGLADFLANLHTEIEDLEGAFRRLAITILQSMADVVASQLAKQFVGMIAGALSGGATTGASSGMSSVQASNFASGGYVAGPGTATSDSIPARLSNGEYVIRAAAVRHYGADFFEMLNRMMMDKVRTARAPAITRPKTQKYASGGLVSPTDQAQRSISENHQSPISLAVVNVKDEGEAQRYLASRRGRGDLMTFINDNRSEISAILKGGG